MLLIHTLLFLCPGYSIYLNTYLLSLLNNLVSRSSIKSSIVLG